MEDYNFKPLNPRSTNMKSVNINLDTKYILSMDFEEDLREHLVGFDDSGARVDSLPCLNGEMKAWFDFSSNSIAIRHTGSSIEVFDFVYQAVHILVNSMIPNADQFEVFDLDGSEELFLTRISWEESLHAWYFQFDVS